MIKVLDSFIADKIAAGEVIERPVSIVKELVENSVDAGADSIIVEIRNGGKSYIRVTDNGSGIPADEVSTAFLRHATSKISSISDLDKISSLGFRGEALASISAVSRLTVVTRTEDEVAGTRIVMHGGREVSHDNVGANKGTTIVVEDVFYNTPARRKFMGSDAREATAIIDLIQQYAICYDSIRFMLVNNGSTIFTTDGDGVKLNAITTVNPTREYSDLLPVKSEHVNGYVSNPGITKSSRRGQLFFVNGRLVSSNVIEKGIEKGYGDRIFSGYPIAILFINVDPSTIDVNIHPGKREIKFLNSNVIINEISSAISLAMTTGSSIPDVITKADPVKYTENLREAESYHYEAAASPKPVEKSVTGPVPEKSEHVGDIREFLQNIERKTEEPVNTKAERPIEKPVTNRPFDFDKLKFKGYVFDAYIIMQSEDELYILDQHAAHERVFYEKFMDNYLYSEHVPQPILTPITVNVTASIYAADRDWLASMQSMGYDIEDFGPDTFIIKGIPEHMTVGEAEQFARTYIENAEDFSRNATVIDKLIMKSCKSAVKANEKLSTLEINDLIRKLSECSNPFSCPHGRPTFIKVSRYEIERSFRRK